MAYGARLESVLGASPRGFESPILRQLPRTISRVRGNVYIGFPCLYWRISPSETNASPRPSDQTYYSSSVRAGHEYRQTASDGANAAAHPTTSSPIRK